MTVLIAALWLVLTGVVEGRVLTSDGAPVAGAVVSIDSLGLSDRTDAQGRFLLADVPEGRWILLVRGPEGGERRVVVRMPGNGRVRLDLDVPASAAPTPEPDPSGLELGGIVRDASTLDPVPHALVEIVEVDLTRTSDQQGRFSFTLPEGTWTLRASAPGFRPLSRTVPVAAGAEAVDLLLEIQPLPVPGLTVEGATGTGTAPALRVDRPSARIVDSMFVRLAPTTVERDLLRAVQTLPSVTPASDYSTALFVRGGTPDQTRIFLDGAPVYNPFHLGGFSSAFAPEAVSEAVLSPGALPASAPSALAGVLEVRTRVPRPDSLRVRGNVGLLSSSATVEAPLFLPATLLVSLRRTYLDLATDVAAGLGFIDRGIPYDFSDGLVRVLLPLGGGGALSASGYFDREVFETGRDAMDHDRVGARWGSDLLTIRAELPVGGRSGLEAGLSTSGFRGHLFNPETGRFAPSPSLPLDTSRVDSSLRTLTADASLTVAPEAHVLMVGLRWERSTVRHAFDPRFDESRYIPRMDLFDRFGSTSAYVRDRWSPGGEWILDAGLRAERPRGRGWHVLPRARLERELGSAASVAVAGGSYVQDWWSLRNEEGGWTAVVGHDLLAPVPADRALPTSWDVAAELRTRIRGWDLRLDAFRKELSGVPTARASIDPVDEPVVLHPDSVRLGDGRVEGLELSASGRLGRTAISGAYRWQRETRTLEGLQFTPRTDRRHRLIVAANRPFWGERELALSVTWMSGIPHTPVDAVLPAFEGVGSDGRPVHAGPAGRLVFGAPNSARLPAYLRVDVESRGEWDLTLFGRQGLIEPYVSLLNVLNAHNTLFAEHDIQGERIFREASPQLPVFPSFGIRWRF